MTAHGLGVIALDVAIKNAIEKNRLVSELSDLRQQLSDDEDRSVWGNSEKVVDEGGSLAAVAKAASLKAERAAIDQTLRQVQWNRRKAAVILGVSYKTLLNKIKECGISRA